jgi:branched-chain amino acid transport system permease protein
MIKLNSPRAIAALLFVLAFAAVPLLSKVLDSSYYLSLGSRILIYALAAVSLNLILGFGGMVSLGHAMYLLIGAYSVGILSAHGIESGWVHMAVAILASIPLAALVGYVCLRTSGMGFIMITLAFAQMLFFVGVSLKKYGGDDGLTIADRSDFGLFDLQSNITLYYFIFCLVLLAIGLTARWIQSPFGMVLRGAKSNARRVNALGHPVMRVQWLAYILSAVICSIAGFCLANLTQFTAPAYGAWSVSGELIVMVILGGAATYFGPWVGATAFLLLEEILPALVEAVAPSYKSNWMLILGVLIVLMTLWLKRGLYGSLPAAKDAQ